MNVLIRASKTNYYQVYFNENKKKLEKIWDGVKGIVYSNKKSKHSINNLLL